MVAVDPFGGQAAAPAPEEAQQPTPPSDPWQSAPAPAAPAAPVIVATGEGKIVMTFKEGTTFDSTWCVVHADSVADAKAILQDPEFKELLDLQKFGATYFRGGSAVVSGGGAAPQQQRQEAPQGALQPPPGSPAAPGPGWTYKTGAKNGRVWHGWFPPYAQKDSLKPEFFDPPK